MRLLIVYCVVVAIGEVIAFGLGLVGERAFPSLSMLIFMALFFGVLWGGWPLSVYITERWLMSGEEVGSRQIARS
jgi:hypothetical protein